jgi:hypothetical protein
MTIMRRCFFIYFTSALFVISVHAQNSVLISEKNKTLYFGEKQSDEEITYRNEFNEIKQGQIIAFIKKGNNFKHYPINSNSINFADRKIVEKRKENIAYDFKINFNHHKLSFVDILLYIPGINFIVMPFTLFKKGGPKSTEPSIYLFSKDFIIVDHLLSSSFQWVLMTNTNYLTKEGLRYLEKEEYKYLKKITRHGTSSKVYTKYPNKKFYSLDPMQRTEFEKSWQHIHKLLSSKIDVAADSYYKIYFLKPKKMEIEEIVLFICLPECYMPANDNTFSLPLYKEKLEKIKLINAEGQVYYKISIKNIKKKENPTLFISTPLNYDYLENLN